MARVGRLAGAILVETGGEYFLVGNTKEPCAWESHGFVTPAEIDAKKCPFVALKTTRPVALGEPFLHVETVLEGPAVAQLLADRFLIERNGSVSDRLWRLVTNPDDELEPKPRSSIEATWLAAMPAPVWLIVRDTVLRCT
ncbi:MAG TPA: precorrin-3B C(17)-methyltransferase [Polyangiaceae bacterium]|jgi:hypothetical protein